MSRDEGKKTNQYDLEISMIAQNEKVLHCLLAISYIFRYFFVPIYIFLFLSQWYFVLFLSYSV